MTRATIVVPRGAEAVAIRRARTGARIVEVLAAGACANALPAFDAGETVVVMGLCGSLGRLKTADVAIYGRIADAHHDVSLDPALIEELTGELPDAAVVNAYAAERVITSVRARTVLAQRFSADVVDMEAAHLAAALSARGVRFAMVRVVSDDASRDLPPLDAAIDPGGRIHAARVALAFARAPLAALAFVRGVRAALRVLTETARAIIPPAG